MYAKRVIDFVSLIRETKSKRNQSALLGWLSVRALISSPTDPDLDQVKHVSLSFRVCLRSIPCFVLHGSLNRRLPFLACPWKSSTTCFAFWQIFFSFCSGKKLLHCLEHYYYIKRGLRFCTQMRATLHLTCT